MRATITSPIAVLALASFLWFPSAALAETMLRLISGWGANDPLVETIESVYIKNVTKASNGGIKIQRSGPEVVPPFEQLQPLSAGVFDILFTVPSYHQAQTGVGAIFYAFKNDLEALRQAGLTKYADDYYRSRYGVRILAMHYSPGSHFVLREPLSSDGTLSGRKLRPNSAYDGMIRLLGGTPVTMPSPEAFIAMRKGTIDGIAIPAFVSADYRLYEVAKFMTRPIFGQSTVLFMVNAAKFDSLPLAEQKVLSDEARRIEVIGAQAQILQLRQDTDKMLKNGVKITNFTDKIGASLTRLYNEGILRTASRSSPNEVQALWEIAKRKNLLNQ